MKIETLHVGSIGTNCYIVCGEEMLCAVIDPGDDGERVAQAVRATGCTPRCILLTHGHYDHVGGTATLLEAFPEIPVYLNRRDVHPSDNPRTKFLFPDLPFQTQDYDEGETVQVGDLSFEVIATPGHTPGGVSLLCGSALFCGDTLFAGSMGRTDLAGGSDAAMRESLRKLGNLPGNPGVYPGHMDLSELETERQTNPYLRQAMGI